MKFTQNITAAIVIALVMFPGLASIAVADELPADSVYQLNVPLETQHGDVVPFASLQGGPVIVSMFYGSCPHVCPMLISTIQQVEKQLPPEARADLRVVMVSVDPERDTPAHLREIAGRHAIDSERWTLARTSPEMTRPLAAVLDIKYKALPDGNFNHTSVLVLLDATGREVARSSKLGAPDAAFVQRVNAELKSPRS
ncbi:MAG TPA: SCO family protein [Gammaproteobacteria bacterium]